MQVSAAAEYLHYQHGLKLNSVRYDQYGMSVVCVCILYLHLLK